MAAASLPILSGAAAGVSAIGGAASTRASNQANKEIAQMNNEFNEKMLEKQMDIALIMDITGLTREEIEKM